MARLGLSLMQAVMFRKVAPWLEEHIEELNELIENRRDPVILILHYALVAGRDGLTGEQFMEIITSKGKGRLQYEAGSVAEQWVAEGEAKGLAKAARRMIAKGMGDTEIAELTELPVNRIAELRKEMGEA